MDEKKILSKGFDLVEIFQKLCKINGYEAIGHIRLKHIETGKEYAFDAKEKEDNQ